MLVAVDLAAIDYGRVAKRSPCYGDGLAADGIVDDFVAAEHGYGVCAVVAVDGESDDLLAWRHPLIGFFNVHDLGLEDGGNGVVAEYGDDVVARLGARFNWIRLPLRLTVDWRRLSRGASTEAGDDLFFEERSQKGREKAENEQDGYEEDSDFGKNRHLCPFSIQLAVFSSPSHFSAVSGQTGMCSNYLSAKTASQDGDCHDCLCECHACIKHSTTER